MNEVTKIAAGSVQVKPLPASSLSDGTKGQKTGNSLPPAAEAAISQPVSVVDHSAIQEEVQAAVAQMNEYIQSTQRDLSFTYDPGSGETVVKVLDRSTQEVIRQIPDEIFLRLAQRLDPEQPLQLFSAQA
jgi:flagellar protein FlaG